MWLFRVHIRSVSVVHIACDGRHEARWKGLEGSCIRGKPAVFLCHLMGLSHTAAIPSYSADSVVWLYQVPVVCKAGECSCLNARTDCLLLTTGPDDCTTVTSDVCVCF